jgi:anti-anti-sigma regulatory factor
MEFSFFRKKPKEKPRSVPEREREKAATPDRRDVARKIAQQTTAKIDAIESEMTRDLAERRGAGAHEVTTTPLTRERLASAQMPPANAELREVDLLTTPPPRAVEPEDEDPGDDVLTRATGIEINTTSASSVLDETVILFADGQQVAAETVLRSGIAGGDMGRMRQRACVMLLELINQRGDRAEFDRLADKFSSRLGARMPGWHEYAGEDEAAAIGKAAVTVDAAGIVVRLPEILDRSVAEAIEEIKLEASAHAKVRMDVEAVRTADNAGAELVLQAIASFRNSRGTLTIAGADKLLAPLQEAAGKMPRARGDAVWMLWLEILRILDRPEEFEETAIQYCVAFEQSPPSWEPPPTNVLAVPSTSATSGEGVPEVHAWQGVIDGDGDRSFTRLLTASATAQRLIVDCGQLRRMTFSAASALLALGRRLRSAGKSVELRNVNPLVAALLQLLGVTELVSVQLRGN